MSKDCLQMFACRTKDFAFGNSKNLIVCHLTHLAELKSFSLIIKENVIKTADRKNSASENFCPHTPLRSKNWRVQSRSTHRCANFCWERELCSSLLKFCNHTLCRKKKFILLIVLLTRSPISAPLELKWVLVFARGKWLSSHSDSPFEKPTNESPVYRSFQFINSLQCFTTQTSFANRRRRFLREFSCCSQQTFFHFVQQEVLLIMVVTRKYHSQVSYSVSFRFW